jgi:hypothetical protein
VKRAFSSIFLLIGVAACDEMPNRTGAARPRASASATPGADARELDAVSLAYVEAARAHAKTCICFSDPFEGLIRDYCDGAGPAVEGVKKAGVAIAALDASAPDVSPAAAAFLREAALHARWLADYSDKVGRWAKIDAANESSFVNPGKPERPGTIHGAVSAFQTLARRYNEWHPNAKVSAIAYGEYRPGGVREGAFTIERAVFGYYGVAKAEFEKKKRETEYLPWIECFDGPCLIGY